MSTFCEADGLERPVNFSFMGKGATKIPALPLFNRIGRTKGGAAGFAKKIDLSEQRLSNWKRRGIPARELPRVTAALGINVETYLREASQSPDRAGEPGAQYGSESATLIEDFAALPTWLQEHIARKASELRRYAESLPTFVRDGMKPPPKDAEGYRVWEREIELDMAKRRSGEVLEQPDTKTTLPPAPRFRESDQPPQTPRIKRQRR